MRTRAVVFCALVVAIAGTTGVRSPRMSAAPPALWPVSPTGDAHDSAAISLRKWAAVTTASSSTTLAVTSTTVAQSANVAAAGAVPSLRDLSMYNGLGTWIDVYDWSATYGKDGDLVDVVAVDRMAQAGVQTLYVQTSKWDATTDVLEPERLLPIIERARALGIRVVAWYLPTLEDPQRDMGRLMAASRLGVDAVAVDIESRRIADVAERNRRLIEISTNLRAALPEMALGAIPFPPVAMDVINPNLWPSFPWLELAPQYDVWLPMSYQTDRKPESGYRDGYRYMAENIDRTRAHLGNPTAPVHAIGGIADRTTVTDIDGIYRAASERGVLGGSLYDWRTTSPDLWAHLQRFRAQ